MFFFFFCCVVFLLVIFFFLVIVFLFFFLDFFTYIVEFFRVSIHGGTSGSNFKKTKKSKIDAFIKTVEIHNPPHAHGTCTHL